MLAQRGDGVRALGQRERQAKRQVRIGAPTQAPNPTPVDVYSTEQEKSKDASQLEHARLVLVIYPNCPPHVAQMAASLGGFVEQAGWGRLEGDAQPGVRDGADVRATTSAVEADQVCATEAEIRALGAVHFDAVTVDFRRREVRPTAGGPSMRLSPNKWAILGNLVAAGTRGCTREVLLKAVGVKATVDTRSIDTAVYEIRRQFHISIESMRGVGYRLDTGKPDSDTF